MLDYVSNTYVLLRRYFFSTCISLWNRKLLGQGYGVLGKGPFPGQPQQAVWLTAQGHLLCVHAML